MTIDIPQNNPMKNRYHKKKKKTQKLLARNNKDFTVLNGNGTSIQCITIGTGLIIIIQYNFTIGEKKRFQTNRIKTLN